MQSLNLLDRHFKYSFTYICWVIELIVDQVKALKLEVACVNEKLNGTADLQLKLDQRDNQLMITTTDKLKLTETQVPNSIQFMTVIAVNSIRIHTEGLMWHNVAQRPRVTLVFDVCRLLYTVNRGTGI